MRKNIQSSISTLFVFIFLLSSCSTPSPSPTALPTSTAIPFSTSTPLPTASNTPLPTATTVPAPERARYVLDTLIDYDAHTVTVDETIYYPNHTGNQLNALVIAIVPNLWEGSFNLNGLSINGTPITTYNINGQRLDISLPFFFKPEEVMVINIQFTLNLPFAEQEDPSVSRPRIYGYTRRQLNLTNWYPFVVPYINGDWVLHEPWYYGEHLVYDAADYQVDVRFADPANVPIVAASGAPEQQADSTRYTITAARTFALAASPEFQVSSLQVGDVIVASYYFPLSKIAGRAALQASAEALQIYSQKYGPYPHKTLSMVMGDFNDGMEYSAFFYLSRDFYSLYDETPANYLIFVAVHETSHQWWFDQVANDQAQQPWLDESLATYSELVYYETLHPDLVSWWWAYRIDFYNPQGFVDIPIYDGQGFRPYTNAAYFQGAHFLSELRARIGDDAFFAFIQDYLLQGRNKIMTTSDFFRILGEHTLTDTSDIVRQYFQNIY
ncbi:MAG TPA: M1 family metallopeptidase [Anaerolineales bacterium]|nr:M1 family metallopeptidase [Anaerolineales bacterium]HMV95197.1 M1 family metallopeptidase [Anaerolineales bacterium]HMX17793.1 M1 family metallopeptidase [Anaerolineales bacterium]HNA53747.1 M1 family metallopeptidase [Anaerolineales bacterium]HNB86292.1 M1 family metallopeptidase [Anaerolineales bacterium]